MGTLSYQKRKKEAEQRPVVGFLKPQKSTLRTRHQILMTPQLIMQANYQGRHWICYFLMSSSEDTLPSYTMC